MNVQMYLLALHIHGPRFTTPNKITNKFASRFQPFSCLFVLGWGVFFFVQKCDVFCFTIFSTAINLNLLSFCAVVSNLFISFNLVFEIAAMPFLFNGIFLIQYKLPRVLSVLVLKIASCLIPYINSFLILNGEWSSFLFKDFPK